MPVSLLRLPQFRTLWLHFWLISTLSWYLIASSSFLSCGVLRPRPYRTEGLSSSSVFACPCFTQGLLAKPMQLSSLFQREQDRIAKKTTSFYYSLEFTQIFFSVPKLQLPLVVEEYKKDELTCSNVFIIFQYQLFGRRKLSFYIYCENTSVI